MFFNYKIIFYAPVIIYFGSKIIEKLTAFLLMRDNVPQKVQKLN